MAFMDIAATVCWADQNNREKVRLGVSRALRGRSPDLSVFFDGRVGVVEPPGPRFLAGAHYDLPKKRAL